MKKYKTIVFGIDINPGSSPQSTRQPLYSLVVLGDGEKIEEYEEIPLHRIIRLCWEYKPKIIGVDNIFELGKDEKSILKLMSLLPPDINIVQVTLGPEGFESLSEVAKKMNIKVRGKLSSLESAYLIALLAYKGVGYRIKLYKEKTKIIVSRKRTASAGGSSQDRYKRRIRSLILRYTRKIKDALDSHGFDYDLLFRRSDSGLDSSVFIVYAPRKKLYGIVKPVKSRNIRVLIKPVLKSKVTLPHGGKIVYPKRKYLIVGIDPGIITGLAIIDINGEIVEVTSGKGLDREEIISKISEYGIPLIIATDVNPPPEAVSKIASAVNAKLFVPPRSLSTSEKQEIVEEYIIKKGLKIRIVDSHQRDALAAALKSYRMYESKLRQVEAYVGKFGINLPLERIKAEIIKGMTIVEAVEREIAKYLKEKETPHMIQQQKVQKETKDQQLQQEMLLKARSKIEELRKERAILKSKIKKLMERVEELELELNELKKTMNIEVKAKREVALLAEEVNKLTREVKIRDEELRELKNKIVSLEKALISLSKGEYKLMKPLSSLTLNSISHTEKEYGKICENDILFIENLTFIQKEVLDEIKRRNILAIITCNVSSEAKETLNSILIPVINLNEIAELVVKVSDNIILYKPELEEYAKQVKEELKQKYIKPLDLEKIILEYRKERWRL